MTRAVSEVNHVGTSRTCGISPAWASQGTWGPNRSSRAVTKAGRKAREAKMPIEPRPWRNSGRLTGSSCSRRREFRGRGSSWPSAGASPTAVRHPPFGRAINNACRRRHHTAAATATAAAATAAIAAAAAARASLTGLCFVDRQVPAVVLSLVEALDRRLGLGVRVHLDESESLRAVRVTIDDDLCALHSAELGEQAPPGRTRSRCRSGCLHTASWPRSNS